MSEHWINHPNAISDTKGNCRTSVVVFECTPCKMGKRQLSQYTTVDAAIATAHIVHTTSPERIQG